MLMKIFIYDNFLETMTFDRYQILKKKPNACYLHSEQLAHCPVITQCRPIPPTVANINKSGRLSDINIELLISSRHNKTCFKEQYQQQQAICSATLGALSMIAAIYWQFVLLSSTMAQHATTTNDR